jgi:lipopolysaccharide export system permease protein
MLRRHLTLILATRLLGCLLALAALVQLLDLLDKAGDIIAHGGVWQLAPFIGLRAPSILAQMLPLATLLGAVLTFQYLTRGAEVTAMQAAGLGLGDIMRLLLPVCVVIAAVQFTLQAEIAPRGDRALADWWAALIPADNPPPVPLWLLAHGDIAAIDHVSADGAHLTGVMIVQRAASGDVTDRLDADRADYVNGHWVLRGVRVADFDALQTVTRPTMIWPRGPRPRNMTQLVRPVADLPLGQLIATLRGRWVGPRGPAYDQTELCSLLAALLDPWLMLLLAAPVGFTPPRAAAAGTQAAVSVALGLGLLVAAGLLGALGAAGLLAPPLAGFAAPVLFGAIGLWRLRTHL